MSEFVPQRMRPQYAALFVHSTLPVFHLGSLCCCETRSSRQLHHHHAGAGPANVKRDLLGPLIILCIIGLDSFQI